MKLETRGFYEEYWSEGGHNPRKKRMPAEVGNILTRFVASGKKCLDIGCGDGSKVASWAQSGINYLGIDVSRNAVEAARRSGLNAMMVEDVSHLPFEDGSFDAVICLEVLEHLFDPLATAREAHRILRPNGVPIATVPNTVEIRRRIEFATGVWNPCGDARSVAEPWRDPHIRFFTIGSLTSMMDVSGFHVTAVGAHFDQPLGRVSPKRRVISSAPYRFFMRRWPGLLGQRLHVVATKIDTTC